MKTFWGSMIVALAVSLSGFAAFASADTLYVLNSGATIEPVNPLGPTEPLTGSFVWHDDPLEGDLQPFHAEALYFSSPSYTITLDPTPPPNEGYDSDTFTDGATFFDVNVFLNGNTAVPLLLGSYFGTQSYTGDFQDPTSVTYTGVDASPVGGGEFVVGMSFTATAVVPEPASGTVVAALIGLAIRRRSKARANVTPAATQTAFPPEHANADERPSAAPPGRN